MFGECLLYAKASVVTQTGKNLPAMLETLLQSLGQEDLLRREWQPTPGFLPGEFHGQIAWQAAVHGVEKSWA